MQVSQKERMMLIILAAVLILLGGYKFILTPAISTMSEAHQKYSEAVENKTNAEDSIARRDVVADGNKMLKETILKASASYFPNLESDVIQMYFNDIADKVKIDFETFAVTYLTEGSTIDEFESIYMSRNILSNKIANEIRIINGLSPIDNLYPEEEAAETGGTEAAEGEEANNKNLDTVDADIQFVCSYAKANAFLDEIIKSKRNAYITSLAIDSTDSNNVYVTATVRCYGIVKIDDSDKLSKDSLKKSSGKSNPFK